MRNTLFPIFSAELQRSLRHAHQALTPLLFFIISVCLFPLSLGNDLALLPKIAPAAIWLSALCAILLALEQLFAADARDGFLDNLLLSALPLPMLVLIKITAHWLSHCLPLIILSPFLGLLLHLDAHEIMIMSASLLLGTPTLCLLGAIGAALTVGLQQQHGLLLPILMMPFYIPVLIFGTGAMVAVANQQLYNPSLAFLGALFLFSLSVSPWLTSVALRMGMRH